MSIACEVSVVDALYEVHSNSGRRHVPFGVVKTMHLVSRAWRLPRKKLVGFWVRLYRTGIKGSFRDAEPLEIAVEKNDFPLISMLINEFELKINHFVLRKALEGTDPLRCFKQLGNLDPPRLWFVTLGQSLGTVAQKFAEHGSTAGLELLITKGLDEWNLEERAREVRARLKGIAPMALYGALCGRKKHVAVWVRKKLWDGSPSQIDDFVKAISAMDAMVASSPKMIHELMLVSAAHTWLVAHCGFPRL